VSTTRPTTDQASQQCVWNYYSCFSSGKMPTMSGNSSAGPQALRQVRSLICTVWNRVNCFN